ASRGDEIACSPTFARRVSWARASTPTSRPSCTSPRRCAKTGARPEKFHDPRPRTSDFLDWFSRPDRDPPRARSRGLPPQGPRGLGARIAVVDDLLDRARADLRRLRLSDAGDREGNRLLHRL